MTNELSKNLKCVKIKGGVEIWKEAERLNDLIEKLVAGKIGFVKIDDELINAFDIIGIFSATSMEETTRRKNGEWKCGYDQWHEKFKKCECKAKNLKGEDLGRFSRGF